MLGPSSARRCVAAAVAAVLVLSCAASTQAVAPAPEPGTDGIGDDYFPLDGNGGYDVRHYDIHDSYAFGTRRLSGWTRIRLVATQDLSSFNLDFLRPVSSVEVAGVPAAVERPVRHELQITPATPLAQGDVVNVLVRYAGFPGRLSYNGASSWLANRHEVVTMNEPHMAAWWFPANDHPMDKARIDLHVRVPRGKQVVANGRLVGRSSGARPTWHWRAAEPMVPYLAFFAAGDFTTASGRTQGQHWLVAVSDRLPRRSRASSMRMLKRTPRLVRWLSHELGDYPFNTTGGLVTGLSPGFALENQTRPVYEELGPGSSWLLVHELAHQWFGDHVAVQRWRDIWLNEGFATYMEERYAETHGGPPAARWLRRQYRQIGAGSDFWQLSIADPGPESLFDTPVYWRGGMTLQALRNRIGDADFRRLLRRWVAQRGGGNGSTSQFRSLAERVSGEDLDSFFDAWLVATTKPAATAANGLR
jgi:aminopeptidase N